MKKILILTSAITLSAASIRAADLTVQCVNAADQGVSGATVFFIAFSSYARTNPPIPMGAPDPDLSNSGVSDSSGSATLSSISPDIEYDYVCSSQSLGPTVDEQFRDGWKRPRVKSNANVSKQVRLDRTLGPEYIPLNITLTGLPGTSQKILCHAQLGSEPIGDGVIAASAAVSSGQLHNIKRPGSGLSPASVNVDCFAPGLGKGNRTSVQISSTSSSTDAILDLGKEFMPSAINTAAGMQGEMQGSVGGEGACFKLFKLIASSSITLTGINDRAEVEIKDSSNTAFSSGFFMRMPADNNGRVCFPKTPEFQYQPVSDPMAGSGTPPPPPPGAFGLMTGGTYFYMASANNVASSGPVKFVMANQRLDFDVKLSTTLGGKIVIYASIASSDGTTVPFRGAAIMVRPAFRSCFTLFVPGLTPSPVSFDKCLGNMNFCPGKTNQFVQTTTGYASIDVTLGGFYAVELIHPEFLQGRPWISEAGPDQRFNSSDDMVLFVSSDAGKLGQGTIDMSGNCTAIVVNNNNKYGDDEGLPLNITVKFATSTAGTITGNLYFPQTADLSGDPIMIIARAKGQDMRGGFDPNQNVSSATKMGFTVIGDNEAGGLGSQKSSTYTYTINVATGSGAQYELFLKGGGNWGLVFREGFFQPIVDLRTTSSATVNFNFAQAGSLKASIYKPDGSRFTPNFNPDSTQNQQFFGARCEAFGEESPGFGGADLSSDGTCRIGNLLPGSYTFKLFGYGPEEKFTTIKKAVELIVGCSTATLPANVNFSAKGSKLLVRSLPAGTPLTLDVIAKMGGLGGANFDFENELSTATMNFPMPTTACKPKHNIQRWETGPQDFYLVLHQEAMVPPEPPAPGSGPQPFDPSAFLPTYTGKNYVLILGSKKNVYVNEQAGVSCNYNPAFAPPPPPCPPGQVCPDIGKRRCLEIPFDNVGTASFSGTCTGKDIVRLEDCRTFGKNFDKFFQYLPYGFYQDPTGKFLGLSICVPNVEKSTDVFVLEGMARLGFCEQFINKVRRDGFKHAIEYLPNFTTGRAVFDTPNYPPVVKEGISGSGAKTINVNFDQEAGAGAALQGVVATTMSVVLQDALVVVEAPFDKEKTLTDANGNYLFEGLASGRHRLRVLKPGYAAQERMVKLINNSTTTVDFTGANDGLIAAPGGCRGTILSQVYPSRTAIGGVKVILINETTLNQISQGTASSDRGVAKIETVTGPDGTYQADGLLMNNVYRIVPRLEGRITVSTNVVVTSSMTAAPDLILPTRPPLPDNVKLSKNSNGSLTCEVQAPMRLVSLPSAFYRTGNCPVQEASATALTVSSNTTTGFSFGLSAAQAAQNACVRIVMDTGRRKENFDFPVSPQIAGRGSEKLDDILSEGATITPGESGTNLEVEAHDLTLSTAAESGSGSVSVQEESAGGHANNSDGTIQSNIVTVELSSVTQTSGQALDLYLGGLSAETLDSVASGKSIVVQYDSGSGAWQEVKSASVTINTVDKTVGISLKSVRRAFSQHLGLAALQAMPDAGLAVYQEGRGYAPLQTTASTQEGTFAIRSAAVGIASPDSRYRQYNFPNPFNLKTKTVTLRGNTQATITGTYIAVTPQGSGTVNVTIRIYNQAGDLVREIAETATANYFNYYHWDGKNESGKEVASGTYFAVIDAPGAPRKTPIKMVVIK
ncbi:MAG: carboxypeptidase regulatory-like domain-containing protein [Elusimicrobia bacterium]|nr:carboxypeptidase regulatory-like domain-containing protein [Elusimicrobiota bacterium]